MKTSHIVVLALAAIFGVLLVDASLLDNVKHHFISHHKHSFKGPSFHTSRDVVLKTASLNTMQHPEFHQDEEHLQHASFFLDATKHQYMVHVQRTLNGEDIARIEDSIGTKFSAYLPHHTYLLFADSTIALKAKKAPGVLWVGAFKPSHKYILDSFLDGGVDSSKIYVSLIPEVLLPITERRSMADAQKIAVDWTVAVTISQIQGVLSVEAVSPDRIVVSLNDRADLEAIVRFFAERPESHWLEPGPIYRALNFYASNVLIDNDAVGDRNFTDARGINGTGVIVGLADTGLDYSTCYFEDSNVAPPSTSVNATARKIVQYVVGTNGDSLDLDGHGTHVAGTIAGDSSQSGELYTSGNGVAKAAKIHFTDISNTIGSLSIPTDETSLFQTAAAAGAKIFAVTWGSGNTSQYTSQANAIDQWIITQGDGLVIIAAGNSGFGEKVNGTRASLTNEAVSKNALVIGSSLSTLDGFLQGYDGQEQQNYIGYDALYGTQTLSDFSGRGPTSDGRIKPDLVAPGESVNSAQVGFCGTGAAKGTSSATAAAAGAAALLAQYFADGYIPSGSLGNGGFFRTNTPSAVMKAMLLHSGQSLLLQATETGFTGIGYPGNGQGFGRIELDQILYFQGGPTKLAVYSTNAENIEVGKGESQRFCVQTMATSTFIKATLYWHDPPNSPSAGISAVNNLDLVLIDEQGREYRTVTADSGQFDQINNVEQIIFKNPEPGYYAIYVYGTQVVGQSAKQAYTLILSSDNITDIYADCDLMNGGTAVCPLDCSNRGSCNATGSHCMCDSGFFGVDCSLTACPEDCNGNGICDYSIGECVCGGNWAPPNCSGVIVDSTGNTTGQTIIQTTTSEGVPVNMFIGVVVAAFIVGAICSVVIGGFAAVKYLEHKRDQLAKKNTDEKGEQDRY